MEDLPLEILCAIADAMHEYRHLAAMMLVSRRFRDGVSLSRRWRIVIEVIAHVQDMEERRRILLDRQESLIYASGMEHERLLRFLLLTREEAYLCLPLAALAGRLESVCFLITKFSLTREEDDDDDDDNNGHGTAMSGGAPHLMSLADALTKTQPERSDRLWNDPAYRRIQATVTRDTHGTMLRTDRPFSIVGAFQAACSCSDGLPIVKYLHQVTGVTATDLPKSGARALLAACERGNLAIVQYLHNAFLPPGHQYEAYSRACARGHLPVVQFLHSAGRVTLGIMRQNGHSCFVESCKFGHLPIVKYLHTVVGMTVDDARDHAIYLPAGDNYPLRIACSNRHLPVVQYLHTAFGLTADDARTMDNQALRFACLSGNLPVVRYLHAAFGLTADDARTMNNQALQSACGNGHLPVVQYLHTAFGLTADDARSMNNEALRFACTNGNLPLVQYLHTAFGLTADDARADGNHALQSACGRGHLPVVQYLHTGFGLTADDVRARDNQSLQGACENERLHVVQYLFTDFGLTADDVRNDMGTLRHAAVVPYLESIERWLGIGSTADHT